MRIHRLFVLPTLCTSLLLTGCSLEYTAPDRLEDLGGEGWARHSGASGAPGDDDVPALDPGDGGVSAGTVDDDLPRWVCQQRKQSCGFAPGTEVDCGQCVGGETCDGTRCVAAASAPERLCTEDGWCWIHPRDPDLLFAGPGALNLSPSDLWAPAEDDVWVLAEDPDAPTEERAAFLHFNGEAWSRIATPPFGALHGIWGSGPNDAHAVGERGARTHWDGTGWTQLDEGGETLVDVFGTDRTNVYAGGGQGEVLRWGGAVWTAVRDPAFSEPVRSIAGRDSRDLWFALADGSVVFFDGEAYRRLPAPGPLPEVGMATLASTREDVWWMGAQGSLFRLDGERWVQFPAMPSLQTSTSLAEHQGSLYTASGDGVFRFQGGAWTRQQVALEALRQPAAATAIQRISVHRVGSGLFLVGTLTRGERSEGFILHKR